MTVIKCVVCGKDANQEWEFCPECGNDPRTGAQGPRASQGATGQPQSAGECQFCGGTLVSTGVQKLRTGGTSGGWQLALGVWAELDEGVLPVEVLMCPACRRVELRVPEAPAPS